jgi:DNA-binding winged helix-turn-helix (wHTH) protein
VHVSPKAFALLAALIERRPKALSKDELHKLLWPDAFVSDANLPNLVAQLREILGDDAHEPRVIRTVPRFGYAFRADVVPEGGRRSDASPFPRPQSSRTRTSSHRPGVDDFSRL